MAIRSERNIILAKYFREILERKLWTKNHNSIDKFMITMYFWGSEKLFRLYWIYWRFYVIKGRTFCIKWHTINFNELLKKKTKHTNFHLMLKYRMKITSKLCFNYYQLKELLIMATLTVTLITMCARDTILCTALNSFASQF